MQMVGNITESQNRLRFNYLQRNTTGVVATSYQELLSIYPDARVTLSPTTTGAVPKLIIGYTSSAYNLDVSGSANINGNLTVTGSLIATSSYANSGSNFVVSNTLAIQSTLTDFKAITPSTNPGVNNLFTQNTGSYTSAFCKYTVYQGTNSRAGEFVTSWNGTTTTYYDNATTDIGNTSGVVFTSAIVTGQIQINTGASTPSGWQVKMLATFM
jgi:hypothetical protein